MKTKTNSKTEIKPARIIVQAQPGAKRTEVVGRYGDAIKIRVQAPPVDGRANDELVRYLAEVLKVPRGNVSLTRGETSRSKSFLITGITTEEAIAILLS